MRTPLFLLFVLLFVFSIPAWAQTYSVDWSTVDGGGGTSTGGVYTMSDAVGQALAGASAAGSYLVEDGFWPGMNTPPVLMQDVLLRGTNRTAKVLLTTLLANDSDPDNDALTVTTVSPTSALGGSLRVDNGWALYTPPPGSNESDWFTYTVADAEGHRVTASVLVQLSGTSTEQPHTLVRLTTLPDGTRWLRFVGIAGRTFSIQATSDLGNPDWRELDTSMAGTNGLFEFVDTELPAPAQRYYRAVTY